MSWMMESLLKVGVVGGFGMEIKFFSGSSCLIPFLFFFDFLVGVFLVGVFLVSVFFCLCFAVTCLWFGDG